MKQIDRAIFFYSERKCEPQTVTPILVGLDDVQMVPGPPIYSGCTPNYPFYYGKTFIYLLLYKLLTQ